MRAFGTGGLTALCCAFLAFAPRAARAAGNCLCVLLGGHVACAGVGMLVTWVLAGEVAG